MRIPPGVRRAFELPRTRAQIARELDDEVRDHIERRAAALRATGLSTEDAYAEARRRFGDVRDLRDYCVSLETTHMQRARTRERLSSVGQDLRFALRQFRKAPGIAFVAAVTLALGIGATSAIFSVVNGVVLEPLPFPHPDRIVWLWGLGAKGQQMHFADLTFDELARANRSFSALAEFSAWDLTLSTGGDAERVTAAAVSKQFFDVLGVRPTMGRLFAPEEQAIGAPMAVVISHGFWMREFGGSPRAIGATLASGATRATVVGVLPAGREFPAGTEIWYPREIFPEIASYTAHNWKVVGRVKNGVTLAQANRDVSTVLERLHQTVGDRTWTFSGEAIPLREQIVGNVRRLLYLLLAASGVLLLIACANVANLLVARMAMRESEIAVRLALGAGRARLAQQLVIETSLLAAAGCAGGLVLADIGIRVLLALRPTLIPRVGDVRLDARVLAFAMVVSAATAVALGLLAAWRGARGDLRSALSQSQRTQGGGVASDRVRASLVVVQLAMTVVLLAGAGLLARSFVRLVTIDPGFRTHGVVVATMAYDVGRGSDRMARRTQYYQALDAAARAIPGVTHVGLSNAEPFSGGSSNGVFIVLPNAAVTLAASELEPLSRDKAHTGYATYQLASPDYFTAMRIPLLRGRVFTDRDRVGAPEVAVVNAALAKKQWPNESAIGKVIEFGNIDGDLTPLTIVGVVGDTHEEDLTSPPQPAVYLSYAQRPANNDDIVVVMSTVAEGSTIAAARQAFREVRPDVSVRFQAIEDILGRSLSAQRFMLSLVAVFSAVALLLATLGIYSVISYLVAQRGREMSIRIALGATGSEIVRLVVGQGITLAVIGAVAGGLAALAATRVLRGFLYDVSSTDPIAFGGVLLVLAVVALAASWVPARRAARIAPADVLRGG